MHKTTSRFWRFFQQLPKPVQNTARQKFDLLKVNPQHRSLYFKKVGKYWSARVAQDYRALAIKDGSDFTWVWIGKHNDYERLIGS